MNHGHNNDNIWMNDNDLPFGDGIIVCVVY